MDGHFYLKMMTSLSSVAQLSHMIGISRYPSQSNTESLLRFYHAKLSPTIGFFIWMCKDAIPYFVEETDPRGGGGEGMQAGRLSFRTVHESLSMTEQLVRMATHITHKRSSWPSFSWRNESTQLQKDVSKETAVRSYRKKGFQLECRLDGSS